MYASAVAAIVIATVLTVPIRVGVRVPNSVTISIPSTITVPTPAPALVPTPAPGSSSSPRAGASPAATPPPLTTTEIANGLADQISNQLAQTMSPDQTKPQVTVEYVEHPLTGSTATPAPNSSGDYVATINF
jgi:hypothetical protein